MNVGRIRLRSGCGFAQSVCLTELVLPGRRGRRPLRRRRSFVRGSDRCAGQSLSLTCRKRDPPPLGEKQRARPEAGRPPLRCANRIPFSKNQNPKPKTQDSKPKTQNPKLKTQNPRLKTQNSKLKTSFVPDGEKQRAGREAFVAACRTCFFLLLFRRGCRIMPHEQEIFKPRYRETGKIAHNGRVWGASASGPLRVLPEAAGHFFLSGGGEP